MKNILYIFSAGIFIGLLSFLGMIQVAYAETRYHTATFISTDTFWDKGGSPYIPEDDIIIQEGATLTIGPGVEVRGPESGYKPSISVVGGSLKVEGTAASRAHIHDLNGIFAINSGSMTLEYTDIDHLNTGVLFDNSRGVIASSTLTDSLYGIEVRRSGVSVLDSRIASNTDGIIIQRSPQPMLMRSNSVMNGSGIGGIGNALEELPMGEMNFVTVTGSIIEGNTHAGVDSKDWFAANMAGNWWGSSSGPGDEQGTNQVLGNVEYDPWLTSKPELDKAGLPCCSSVLFLPGLEASNLYRTEQGMLGRTKTNTLWEPNRNDDVRKLFLDSTGSSTDRSIYAGDPIGKAFGMVGIYGSFMAMLDNLSREGTISEWQSYGYDWRKPIAEVVAGSERRATTTDSLIGKLMTLAARSKTGKVSIVAHSNGGLVAKYLVKTLVDMGKESLIDTVISVAVPYLGTPQAVLGLLHGDKQEIADGAILKQSVARELGINMPSAYSLLPSREYFSKMLSPSIAFAATTTVGINNGVYPQTIASYEGQKAFILDQSSARNVSTSSKTTMPIKGNAFLANAAEALHAILDPFAWPATIARWAIVGWGNMTAKGIEYSEKSECSKSGGKMNCVKVPIYTATTTSMGDGTVVAPSATYEAGNTASIDLPVQKSIDHKSIDHANILEASTTKSAVSSILSANPADGNTKVIEALSKLPGVTMGEPDYTKEKTFLVVSTHSPVDLHIYDKYGNHTGITAPPVGIVFEEEDQGFDEDLYTFSESDIPGSDFQIHDGDVGNETIIALDDDHTEDYLVVIDGAGFGTFDYVVEHIRGSEVLDHVEYIGLPVNPLMVATGTIMTVDSNTISTLGGSIRTASTTTLKIDIDGNGVPDIIPRQNTEPDPIVYLESLKKTVIELVGSTKQSKDLVKRIDRLEDLTRKDKLTKVRDNTEKLKKRIIHKKTKVLSVTEKQSIIDMIDLFVAQFE